MSSIILFLKSHIAGYTRRDGTYVKPHNRKGGPAAHAEPGQLALFTTPASAPEKPQRHKVGQLYHGTAAAFDKFDPGRAGHGVGYNDQGEGFYMTTDPDMARYFAREASGNAAAREGGQGSAGAVMPVHVGADAKLLDLNHDKIDPDKGRELLRKWGLGENVIASIPKDELADPHRLLVDWRRYAKNAPEMHDAVRDMGHDGIVMDEERMPEGVKTGAKPRTVVLYNHEHAKIEKPLTGSQQARQAKYSTKAGPTANEAADPRRKYYVTMARDGVGVARLAGPFDTHDEALAHVDRAREEAEKADPRAAFDSFGTAGVESDNHRPGVLNERLGIRALAAPGPAANGSKFGTLFHGSAKPFEKYDMSRSGKGGGYRHQGDAVYLTSDQKGYARYFAGTSASKESFRGSYGGTMSRKEADEMERSEGAVMPATLDPSAKILDMRSGDVPDDVKKLFDTSVGDPEIAKRLSKRVRELGYDGIAFVEPNAPEGWKLEHNATTVAVYNPDKVRFHADKAVRGADLSQS